MSADKTANINLGAIQKLDRIQVQGETDLVVELIDSLLLTSPPKIVKIESFIAEKNLVGLKKEAHNLKSSMAAMGALSVSTLCEDIEYFDESRSFEQLQKLGHELKKIYLATEKDFLSLRMARTQTPMGCSKPSK